MLTDTVMPIQAGLSSTDMRKLREFLIKRVSGEFEPGTDSPTQFQDSVAKRLQSVYLETGIHLPDITRDDILGSVYSDIVGYGPIQVLLDDPEISEIMVNGPKKIYIEKEGKLIKTGIVFDDDQHVIRIIERIIQPLGRRVDADNPSVDARLPDGSRVNAVIGPVALDGPSITIRKFRKDKFKVDDLIRMETLTKNMADFLRACVLGRLNIVVAGGTGSGKTTLLNVLSGYIPEEERIITIEDTAELQLQQDHVLRMETKTRNVDGGGEVTVRDLVRNSLRMRPDRIIVGECRGGEALDMLQALNTGHDGSLTTVHANSPRDAICAPGNPRDDGRDGASGQGDSTTDRICSGCHRAADAIKGRFPQGNGHHRSCGDGR